MTKPTIRKFLTRFAFTLLWLFFFTLPLTQTPEIPAAGWISRIAGLATMALGALALAGRKQFRLLSSVHMFMAGFILWSTVTLTWSVDPDLTVQRILTYLQLFVLVVLIWELCVEEEDVLRILSAFVLGTIVPALSTLQGFLPGQNTLYERAATPGFDPDNLAFILALSIPASYYLILRDKSAISALYRLQMGFAICAILMSGTAAALIAMTIGLSLVCWTFHTINIRTRANVFALILMLGGAIVLALPSCVWKHFWEESRNGGITLTTIVDGGLKAVHSTPAGGLGAGVVASKRADSPVSAKNPLTLFSETGVIGVAWFLVMLGALFLAAEQMSGINKSFWLTVLAAWAVSACLLSWECTQSAWLLFGLLAAHAACLKQQRITENVREQRRNYCVEQGAEVWS
jgi:hypothetical protein